MRDMRRGSVVGLGRVLVLDFFGLFHVLACAMGVCVR